MRTPTTEIYTLSLHDALPISAERSLCGARARRRPCSSHGGEHWSSPYPAESHSAIAGRSPPARLQRGPRSEEHTSELQSHVNLVCRLLLEKKKQTETSLLTC